MKRALESNEWKLVIISAVVSSFVSLSVSYYYQTGQRIALPLEELIYILVLAFGFGLFMAAIIEIIYWIMHFIRSSLHRHGQKIKLSIKITTSNNK